MSGVIPVAGPPVRLVEPATQDDRRAVAAAVLRYRWLSPVDGKRFLGWLVASVVGGGLEWRPHAWLSGPAESGKSWLLKTVAKPICGGLCVSISDPTVAALARMVRSDSVPVLFE